VAEFINGGVYAYDNNQTLVLYEDGYFCMFGHDAHMELTEDDEGEIRISRKLLGKLVLTLPLTA
jgi:hypothetical protein